MPYLQGTCRHLLVLAAPVLLLSAAAPTIVVARTLSFEERVAAQEAIERVYYAHQIGATRPFADAVPPDIIEARVHAYLKQSAALEEIWSTPVTVEMLRAELERIARGTRFPERLEEIYAALDHDPVLVQECFARPTLVERLTRNFYSFDAGLHASARAEAEDVHDRLMAGTLDASAPEPHRTVLTIRRSIVPPAATESQPGQPDDLAPGDPEVLNLLPEEFDRARSNAPREVGGVGSLVEGSSLFTITVLLDETPDSAQVATYTVRKREWSDWWGEVADGLSESRVVAVATAEEQLPAVQTSGSTLTRDGEANSTSGTEDSAVPETNLITPCTADDTWDYGSFDDVPSGRAGNALVWTGSLVLVWGGFEGAATNTGGRYDPLTDTWTPMATTGAPANVFGPPVVWTGSQMIVWGGSNGSLVTAGGMYDPLADAWTPMATAGAPTGRFSHTAVWTGSQMIVWGGYVDASTNTGGRYDPAADTWTPTSTVGAPTGRKNHTAVWTGNQMVVWGGRAGASGDLVNSGGRYDPLADAWAPTSTMGAPAARSEHTAVWTGSRMVVWGGGAAAYLNTGGRYDPLTDTWTATVTTGAPAGRRVHTAVWTGNQMIVWGGENGTPPYFQNSGGRYDPVTDTWTPTSAAGAPARRTSHSATWTGSQMIVWGGYYDQTYSRADTGGRYDPLTDSWTPTFSSGAPTGRGAHSAIWTGNQMIVWGGSLQSYSAYVNSGGRYDPLTDAWSPTATAGAPSARRSHTAVWTGTQMIVWGGEQGPFAVLNNTGGRYDPLSDSWSPTATVGAPSMRSGHIAVWTGSKMVVWGGADLNTGGRYDPITDTWTPTSVSGAPSARSGLTAVWNGAWMLVWGGGGAYFSFPNAVGRYDPITDVWAPSLAAGAPIGRVGHTAIWTGSEMIVWGGYVLPGTAGGRYNPLTDTWSSISLAGAPAGSYSATAVWTGTQMIVWSGYARSSVSSMNLVNSGARYEPLTDTWTPTSTADAPLGRYSHTATWTGSEMIVWGGYPTDGGSSYLVSDPTDRDIDGVPICANDCDDSNALVYPGATETCDDVDNDCDGAVDEDFDGDGDGFRSCGGDCNDLDPAIHPSAIEICDRTDNDCDGLIDEGDAADVTSPELVCPLGATVECSSPSGTLVSLPPATVHDNCDGSPLVVNSYTPGGADITGVYPLGEQAVVITARDLSGNESSCTVRVVVRDTSPPAVTLTADPILLWPPNHKMTPVALVATAVDTCDGTMVPHLVSVGSNEPDDATGEGDGHTTNDIQGANIGTNDSEVLLRAERAGNGGGRLYSVRIQAEDASGNLSAATQEVSVPVDHVSTVEPVQLGIVPAPQTDPVDYVVEWQPVVGATAYNVIRGDVRELQRVGSFTNLGEVACLARESGSTSAPAGVAGENPPSGQAHFFLIEFFAGRFSGYGTESAGGEAQVTGGDSCH